VFSNAAGKVRDCAVRTVPFIILNRVKASYSKWLLSRVRGWSANAGTPPASRKAQMVTDISPWVSRQTMC